MQTAIITGINGQIGSYFVEFLLDIGIRVIGTVRSISSSNSENGVDICHPNLILESMDLTDAESVHILVAKYRPDYFINCAASSFVGSSWDCPDKHYQHNTLAVINQLEAIRKNSPKTRYLNMGSAEEFKYVKYSPQNESHPLGAKNPYGLSKIAAREVIKVWREQYGLYAVQCWCYNTESPRRHESFVTRKITKGVARIARALNDGKSFEPLELGNINDRRDWSYVTDVVDGAWKMLNQVADPNGIPDSRGPFEHTNFWMKHGWRPTEYLFASGETYSIREFVEKAFGVAGIQGIWEFPSKNKNDPKEEVFTFSAQTLVRINPIFYRPFEGELLVGDASRAKLELGWSSQVSFNRLVERMVKADLAAVGL